jgi:hypothetical protein
VRKHIVEIKKKKLIRNRIAALMLAIDLLFSSVLEVAVAAQEGDKTKSGYDDISQFGGPSSVGANLKEADEIKTPFHRLENIDNALKPWFGWPYSS